MANTHLRRGQPCRPQQIRAFRPVSAELIHSRYHLVRTDPKPLNPQALTSPTRAYYICSCAAAGLGEEGMTQKMTR